MSDPRYPALYQVNTRVWLTELSQGLERRASRDDIPDPKLDVGLFAGLRLARQGDERLLVTVNYASNQSRCYVPLPFADFGNGKWRLEDVIGDATYERNDLHAGELYLDEPAWKAHVLSLTKLG